MSIQQFKYQDLESDMNVNNVFNLSARRQHMCSKEIDKFLKACPNTKDIRAVFSKEKDISEIETRNTQKNNFRRENGGKFYAAEAVKTIKMRNETTFKNKLKTFEQFMQFAYANYKTESLNCAFTPRICRAFIKYLGDRVINPEPGKPKLSLATFKQRMSDFRIMSYYINNTKNYRHISEKDCDFKKETQQACEAISKKVKENKMGVEKAQERRAYTQEEIDKILNTLKNPVERMLVQLGIAKGYRSGNLCKIYPDTKWQRNENGKAVRVYNKNTIAVYAKGGQRRDCNIENVVNKFTNRKILDEIKELVDEKNVFKYNRKTFEEHFREACLKNNITATSLHNLRYTFAVNLFLAYIEIGLSKEEALKRVSINLFHKRVSITYVYLHDVLVDLGFLS